MNIANIGNTTLRRAALVIVMPTLVLFWAAPFWAFGFVSLVSAGMHDAVSEWWGVIKSEFRLLAAGWRKIWSKPE